MRISYAAVVAAAVSALALAPAAGAADFYSPGAPILASPPESPFDPCTAQPDSPEQPNFEDTEVEPLVAVNPTTSDPGHENVIGVMQEDRWVDGGAHGLMAGISNDGGATYGAAWAKFSSCSGNAAEFPRATDPWVSFDSAGRAYQIGLPIIDGQLADGAVTVSHSDNGGATWTPTVDVRRVHDDTGIVFVDKESITADPYHPGRAWATWIEGNLPGENISFAKLANAFSYRGTPMISRTTDGGDHWSKPARMTNSNIYAQGNQIVVEPDGTLIDTQAVLFKGAGFQPNNNGVYQAVMRSRDGGKTWSSPSKIAPLHLVDSKADGKDLRVGDYLPDVDVDPQNGNLYVTWADSMGGSTNKIVLSRSTDGGRHWSKPVKVSTNDAVNSFNHAVAVAHDGDVAVMYYDTSPNDDSTDADGIPTNVYLRHSSDGGKTWSDATDDPIYSFDFALAPPTERGFFVGDYQGLAAIGDKGLLAFFGVAGDAPATADVRSIRLSR